ncbi:MAG: hypothetical protein Q4G04_02955 [bacterium]|nr:hypothetical protein [bacterium]
MKNESNLVIKIVAIICIIAVIGIVIINVFKPKWFEEKVKPVDSNVNTLDSEQLKNVDYFLTLIKGYNLDYLDQENKSNISNFNNLTNKTNWLLGTYNLI